MKRLGILAVALPSNGGTFQYTLSLLQTLSRRGSFDLTLYTSQSNHHYDHLGFALRRIRLSPIDHLKLVGSELVGLRLDDPFRQEDLLVAPIYSPILLHTDASFVFTLHDLQERYLPHNFTLMQRTWRRYLQGRLCNRASAIICESEFVRRDIIRFFGLEPARVATLPSPPVRLAEEDSRPEKLAALRDRLDLPARFIFYPARFWPHKNHLRLVEAFSQVCDRFPDVHLLFTGTKRDEFDRVFSHVRALNLQHRIRHLGYIEQRDLAALYKLALGLVMPSLFESVSIPVYEAQQAGTPVCASGILAIAEQVGNSGLTFDPLSVSSISEVLGRLLGDAELRSRLGTAGRKQFESMDWENSGDRLENLLNRLIQSAPEAPPLEGAQR